MKNGQLIGIILVTLGGCISIGIMLVFMSLGSIITDPIILMVSSVVVGSLLFVILVIKLKTSDEPKRKAFMTWLNKTLASLPACFIIAILAGVILSSTPAEPYVESLTGLFAMGLLVLFGYLFAQDTSQP